jgi:hypothetical protein
MLPDISQKNPSNFDRANSLLTDLTCYIQSIEIEQAHGMITRMISQSAKAGNTIISPLP